MIIVNTTKDLSLLIGIHIRETNPKEIKLYGGFLLSFILRGLK